MKKAIFVLMFLPAVMFAQQSNADTIKVTEETYECVDSVYENPDAIKLILQRLASDKKYFRELHREIMDDPEMRELMRELMRTNREMMGQKNKEMRDDSEENEDLEV